MAALTWLVRDVGRMAGEAAEMYFRPFYRTGLAARENRRKIQKYGGGLDDAFIIIQKAISYNQGALIQYSFLAAEKHKALKEAFRSDAKNSEEIQVLTQELMNFLNKEFYQVCLQNFEFLHALFSGRSPVAPRICIKGNFKTALHDEVISIFRDHNVDYNSDTAIENNTGFHRILKNGKYFLENNIPQAAVDGKYQNPRLDWQRLNTEGLRKKSPDFIRSVIGNWRQYWYGAFDNDQDESAFYKSTMILPLTLWNRDISNEFREMIPIDDVERYIFGFLCIDHKDIGFFDADRDVLLGYIFADLLSVFAFIRLVYTEFSSTFEKINAYLDEHRVQLEIQRLVRNLLKDVDRNVDEIKKSREPIETKRNVLVQSDDVLLRYARPDSDWKSRER